MRSIFFPACLLFISIGPLSAETPGGAGACQANDASCSSMPILPSTAAVAMPPPSKPEWEAELEKARKAGEACQRDIEKFCDGVQVGEGRLEDCLKAHKAKLSKKCKKAQGWR